jgi:uncharacterized protein (TIGR02147 family)
MTIFDYDDYKDYLKALADRSPRGFKKKLAEDAGCQTAYVSHVLNGSAHFNWDQTEAIGTGLGLPPQEKEFLLLLLEFTRGASPGLKKFLRQKMDQLREAHLSIKDRVKVRGNLSKQDQAQYYSVWYYAAIHVILTIPKLQTKEAIAEALSLDMKLVTQVLEFLVSVGLASKDLNKYKPGASVHLEKSSPLITQHHTNWRLKTIHAFESGKEDNLHFSSVVTISQKDFQKIRSMLIKEIEAAVEVIKASKEETTAVLAMDFFEL